MYGFHDETGSAFASKIAVNGSFIAHRRAGAKGRVPSSRACSICGHEEISGDAVRPRPCQEERERRSLGAAHQDRVLRIAVSMIGSVRMRSPVAAKIAFVTAGATIAVPASPMPPGASVLLTRWVSTTGASFIRIGR
jgi:hypothetical protein